ncbi:MAG: nucleotidyltransferase domain-containing protein [Synergistaceae bacterium]|nr:nucleotidyltransferase domain-containing protein [Synergistaceae bacterium]
MVDINSWLEIFSERLESTFPNRIWFIGLQGSYARGEAKETSDLDIVVIFDRLAMNDLELYREMLNDIPEREKICGFVSGYNEIMNWETSELFQFCHDTIPIKGSLEGVLALVDDDAIRRAVRSGACSIYHACVHNFLHERDSHILEGLYKSAAFVIQASYFMETRHYVASHRELSEIAGNYDREILCPAHGLSFDELSAKLFVWAVRKISDGKQE